MPAPPQFVWTEKLPAILGRINPLIDEANVQAAAVQDLEAAVDELSGTGGPDLTLLFENGLI